MIIAQPTPIAPNTKVLVGALALTLNEQYWAGGQLTVNAVHLSADVPGVVKTNIVISSATSGLGSFTDIGLGLS